VTLHHPETEGRDLGRSLDRRAAHPAGALDHASPRVHDDGARRSVAPWVLAKRDGLRQTPEYLEQRISPRGRLSYEPEGPGIL
jgi:hypothetical protein